MTGTDDPIILFGGGRMGGAMLRSWFAAGIASSRTTVVDTAPSDALIALARERGFSLNPTALAPASGLTVVLAVKPQVVAALGDMLAKLASPDTLVLSIMAGKTLDDLHRICPVPGRVRAMPNLPAAIGAGTTVAVAASSTSTEQQRTAQVLLGATGTVEWLADEALIDAATGLSGSGPAYVFYFSECLTRAGIEQGFPPETAARLARGTIAGAGAMLAQVADPADKLRADVTSPAGTTEAGLRVLMADGTLERLAIDTVAAAAAHARALAG